MDLHYKIAGKYKPDAHLIGSNTVKVGVELYGGPVPKEEKKDFVKPKRIMSLAYWVIPDTKGILENILHVCRRFEFCRDVILLVSNKTPTKYLNYLKEREYDYHIMGEDQVDLRRSLQLLSEKYGVKTVLADTGKILGNLLLNQGLVNEISLLIHPIIVGAKSYNIFGNANSRKLKLHRKEMLGNNYVWLAYVPELVEKSFKRISNN